MERALVNWQRTALIQSIFQVLLPSYYMTLVTQRGFVVFVFFCFFPLIIFQLFHPEPLQFSMKGFQGVTSRTETTNNLCASASQLFLYLMGCSSSFKTQQPEKVPPVLVCCPFSCQPGEILAHSHAVDRLPGLQIRRLPSVTSESCEQTQHPPLPYSGANEVNMAQKNPALRSYKLELH